MTTFQKSTQLPRVIACTVLLSCLFTGTVFAEIAVITNKATPAASLSASQVRAIFLKKSTKFPNGSTAIPGDQNTNTTIYENFGKKLLKKKPNQLSAYWSKRIFSGKAVPPDVIGNDDDMMAWVAKTRGSVGYVDAHAVNQSVKVLLTIP
jgi:ABC-type phosphate transport system substrate-binding protein